MEGEDSFLWHVVVHNCENTLFHFTSVLTTQYGECVVCEIQLGGGTTRESPAGEGHLVFTCIENVEVYVFVVCKILL